MIEKQTSPLIKAGRVAWKAVVGADALMYGWTSWLDKGMQSLAEFEAYEAGVEGRLPARIVMAMAFNEALGGGGNNVVTTSFKKGAITRVEGQLEEERAKVQNGLNETAQTLKVQANKSADNVAGFSAVTVMGVGLAGAGMVLDRIADKVNMGEKTKSLTRLVAAGLSRGGTALVFGGVVETGISALGYLKASTQGIENAAKLNILKRLDLNLEARRHVMTRWAA